MSFHDCRVSDRDSSSDEESEFSSEEDPRQEEDEQGEKGRECLEVNVKCVGNGLSKTLQLKLAMNASVLDLKTEIADLLQDENGGLPVDRQRLIFFGKMLVDNEALLRSSGFKMGNSSPNFVHLSPLPASAIPPPSASKRTYAEVEPRRQSSDSHNNRAMRRRRREHPYPFVTPPRGGGINVDATRAGEETHARPASIQRPEHVPSSCPLPPTHSFGISGNPFLETHSVPLMSLSRPSSMAPGFISPLHAAAVSSSMLLRAQLFNQRAASLYSQCSSVQQRLIRISVMASLDEEEFNEAASGLERLSQEAAALALTLRASLPGPHPMHQGTPNPLVSLSDRILREAVTSTSRDPAHFMGADTAPLYLPSPWRL